MSSFLPSDRIQALPKYIFSEINAMKAQVLKEGRDLISLAIGDPDLPTPAPIVEKMKAAIENPKNHQYSDYEGSMLFRKAMASYYKRRFNVSLDPETEVIALIGSKEGLAHFPWAVCNPGDAVLYPSPGFPAYKNELIISDVKAIPISHRKENQFLPDPKEVEKLCVEHKPKLMILNYPSNPTSVTPSLSLLSKLVDIALQYRCVIAYDNAYADLYFDSNNKPPSILQIEKAKECSVEFNTLSKTLSMSGWRIGAALGNKDLIAALLKIKTNIDSGPLLAVQEAAAYGLDHAEKLVPPLMEVYKQRKEYVVKRLNEMDLESLPTEATFFLWVRVPKKLSSMAFIKQFLQEEAVVVTPGDAFGPEGEGFFRLALTAELPRLEEAMARLSRFIKSM